MREVGHALFRALVPIVGILFLGLDAHQVLLLYAFDTWVALTVSFALMAWPYIPVHPEDQPSVSELINGIGGVLTLGMFAASLTLLVASWPLWIALDFSWAQMRAILDSPAFLQTAAAQTAAATLSFVWQLRHGVKGLAGVRQQQRRFGFALGRWMLVYFVAVALVQSFSAPSIAFMLVLIYGATSVVAEALPSQTRERIARRWEDDKRSGS